MVWTPHSTVATIIEKDGKFLMIEERSGGKLVINQPAGHLEENETFLDAAIRETQEEAAWTVKPKYIVGLYVYKAASNGVTYHRMCFAADPVSHAPDQALDTGIERAFWLTRDEVAEHFDQLRSPLVLQCIDDYLAGQQFPLTVINEHQEQPA